MSHMDGSSAALLTRIANQGRTLATQLKGTRFRWLSHEWMTVPHFFLTLPITLSTLRWHSHG